MQPITDLKDIKIYFPFLINRNVPIRVHKNDIISYLLLADKVILSPDHIFNDKVVIKNAEFLKNDDLFAQLFKHGQIITTSTDKNVRDIKDIILQRSKITVNIPNFSIPIYFRDGEAQKNIYADFFLKEFESPKKLFYEKDKVIQLESFIKTKPGHHDILNKINRLKFCKTNKKIIDDTKYLARIAYLKAGADGNNAIMPTFDSNNYFTFFNHYYSLRFVRQFAYRVSKKIKCDITELSFQKFQQISSSLKTFKDDYFQKTTFFKELHNEVYSALEGINKRDNYRKYKQGVNFLIGLVLGALIEDFVLPLVGFNYQYEFALKIILAAFFEKYRIFEKLLSVANKIIDNYNFQTNLTVKFGELVDKFDNGLNLI